MDKFIVQDLIIGLGTEEQARFLSQIYICNKSQIICLEQVEKEDLPRLKEQLNRILALLDKREDELQDARRSK